MKMRNVEDVYILSPMQQGMLFHVLHAPEAGLYFEQDQFILRGALDVAGFARAWQQVIDRHPILRTSFVWEGLDEPLQLVRQQVAVPWTYHDWRDRSAAEQTADLAAWLEADRVQGITLTKAPLLRLTLIQLSDATYHFICTSHHLLLDGWSGGLVFQEVFICYDAFCRGVQPVLPPVRPYRDYIAWLQRQSLAEAEQFWRQQLAGVSGPTPLGVDRRASEHGSAGQAPQQRRLALSDAATATLNRFAQQQQLTLNTLVQGAWALLLSRYSGQSDVVFGVTGSGRPVDLPGAEQMVGLFISTLPARVEIGPDARVTSWLRAIQAQQLEARQYEYTPLSQIQKWSELPAGSALFESILVFENYAGRGDDVVEQYGGINCAALPSSERTNLPLTVLAVPGPQLELHTSYDPQRFDAPTIERMLGHLQVLLEQLAAQPEQLVRRLPLLSAAERRQLLLDWNATATVYPGADQSLHALIEAQAAATPDAPALVFEEQRLSYAELNRRANQLAHYLQSLGVGAETLVGVCAERSIEMVVALLAVLKAGGAYVPIDPSYPQDRLQFMLQDARTPVLLTQQHLAGWLPEHGAQLVCLDSDWPTIAQLSTHNPASQVSGDTIAYMIYTSGSTGRPKGAMNTHHAIVNRLLWMQAQYGLTPADRVLQKTPFSFDVSVWEFFWPLLTGATLVVARPGGHQDPAYLVELIQQQRITTLHFVPPMLQALVAEPGLPNCTSLRRVICSGEALPADLPPRFFACVDAELHNLYGPTEAAVDVSYWPCAADDAGRAVPIGYPVANTQLYILDPQLQPLPIGVAGEVYIGGVQLARGYWNRPALTAERFIPDPFSPTLGARMYRTGDLATYRPDGAIEYLGRIDFQVKLRGFRIELGEIEQALVALPGVREAVVLAREDRPGVKRLIAYVVPTDQRPENQEQQNQAPGTTHHAPRPEGPQAQGNDSPSSLAQRAPLHPSVLRQELAQCLPEYMVPSVIMVLPAFPLTANGKLDRRALPLPEQEQSHKPGLTAARTPTEEVLAAIWAEVLGIAEVGVEDNFFALGGDSIRSIQVVSYARERGLVCALPQIAQYPTIRELARQLSSASESLPPAEASQPFSLISAADRALLSDEVEDAYPLTQLQAGMLFHSAYSPATAIYHDVFTFHLAAPFDQPALLGAIAQLTSRHPVLRASFDLSGFSEPLQLIHRQATIPLDVVDLRGRSEQQQAEELSAWLEQEKHRAFDWNQPPLLRFQIHRRSDTSFEFAVSFHHIILDGWSCASMLTELFESYMATLGGTDAQLVAPTSTFREFVALERAMLASEEAQRYWLRKLDDATITRLPRLDAPAQAEASSEVVTLDAALGAELSAGLKQLARTAAVPLKSVLLAAHLRVMLLLSGTSDVLTGVVANGRPETLDGERVLGLFLNTLPFRQQLSGGSWIDLVRATFATEQEQLPYRRYPMPKVQQMLGGQALFETAFNFIHFHVYSRLDSVSGLSILGDGGFEQTNFTFLANFGLDVEAAQVHLTLRSDNSAISRAQLATIQSYYLTTLAAMVEQPGGRYETSALLSPRERQQLIDWNAVAYAYPRGRAVHQLVAEQAARRPDADALIHGAQRLSYAELDRRANQLAHYLQRLGVGPDVLVGVCLERSIDLVLSLLAVLKAGGAYVPLDPSYPQERLGFILSDTQPAVLLTTRHLRALLPADAAHAVCLDREWPLIERQPASAPRSTVGAEHLAYVMYTSGSTGRPKGVAIPHRGIVRLICNTNYIQLSEQDRLTHVSNISFDAATFEIWGALLSGAALVIVDKTIALSPELFAALLREDRITVQFMTTAWFNQLMSAAPEAVSGLRYLLFGGEACDPQRVQAALPPAGPQHLLHMYGPTESTTYATWYEVCSVPAGATTVPIGGPVANTEVYLLDAQMQPVPVGTPGELYIGGDGLSHGYHNRPALSAEKFVPDPVGGRPGARLYKTGDLGRYRPDGAIEFLGRNDHQIKLRGFRIELGEIETTLTQHPAVQQVVVLAREDQPGQKYLAAYVVGEQSTEHRAQSTEAQGNTGADVQPLVAAELRDFLKERLPDYMVPAALVVLPALPLTPNGKVDRRALPVPEQAGSALRTDGIAPRDVLELQLVRLWEDLLHTGPIGVTDNFFDLGGHSLLVVHLMGRISKEFGQDLPLSTLFQSATVEQLAAILRERVPSAPPSPLVPIQPGGSRAPFFCVHPGGGTVFCYMDLAREIGPDQPFYGLQDPYLYTLGAPVVAIPEMAAHYIAALRAVQPDGPYQLGGWSFGGIVAFEMAQQLTAQGHAVALVALLDPGAPRQVSQAMDAADDAAHLTVIMSELLPALDQGYLALSSYLRGLSPEQQLQYATEQIDSANVALPTSTRAYLERQLQMFRARIQAISAYQPQVYGGQLTLFRASEIEAEYAQHLESVGVPDLMVGWSDLSSMSLEVCPVPGEHATMMTPPYVQVLADQLRARLDQADDTERAIADDEPLSDTTTSCTAAVLTQVS